MRTDPVRAIADAVLYEGYILWPYRRSALKNQRRFTFGGVYPPAHSAAHPDDPERIQTQVLVQAPSRAEIEVTVRFLQVVRRRLMRRRKGRLEEVDELIVEGKRHLAWEEAVERELSLRASLESLQRQQRLPIAVDPASEREAIGEAGLFVRSWRAVSGELQVTAEAVQPALWRLTAVVVNLVPGASQSRQRALEQTLCSTHLLLQAGDGWFISATDPPPELTAFAESCENVGTWPVLVGDPEEHRMMLCSPIILEDHPRVAPESPGDLFDGGEIDQLLILNILSLTDDERSEMLASDPRAREILERTEALTPEQLIALHGTIREFGSAR